MYLLLDDKKYLTYFKKTIKYTLALILVVAILFFVRRLLYV
jgi:hypothetical protein